MAAMVFVVLQDLGAGDNLYDILIALVFGFSGLNVLGLVSKRFERPSRGLNFNETLAVAAMVLSVCFLGSEMLHVFHIFPIKLQP